MSKKSNSPLFNNWHKSLERPMAGNKKGFINGARFYDWFIEDKIKEKDELLERAVQVLLMANPNQFKLFTDIVNHQEKNKIKDT